MAKKSSVIRKNVLSFTAEERISLRWDEGVPATDSQRSQRPPIPLALSNQAMDRHLGVAIALAAASPEAAGPKNRAARTFDQGSSIGHGSAALGSVVGAAKESDQISIVAPTQSIDGYSQSRLGDEWWKTIYSIPLNDHFGVFDDSTDIRGRRGSAEKALAAQFNASILFIGGAFGEISQRPGVRTLERTVVLPNNGFSTIFFPLLNGNFDNVVKDSGTGSLTVQELKDLATFVFNTSEQGGYVSDLFASVDGMTVKDLTGYRQATEIEDAFSYTTPYPIENSLISSYGVTGDWYLDNPGSSIKLNDLAVGRSLTIGPEISDGYWMAVDVKGGDHTLNFGGTLSDEQGPFFALNVTYNILNQVNGTNGIDRLTGSTGNDFIDGRNGGDYLLGQKGDDLLVGGNGRDLIDGGKDDDELWGDAGKDIFVFKQGYGRDTIFDFSPGETVEMTVDFAPLAIKDNDDLPFGPSAQLDFGKGDVLTFAGVQSSSLAIQAGMIVFV